MSSPGTAVQTLLGSASETVLIVAPFIRSHALERLLEAVPEGVEVSVVTRWRPLDIISGASDLGVLDVTDAAAIPLFLRHDLHAKLFAADGNCLVGSANVTATALGWREPANLELLSPVARDTPEIADFERELLRSAVRATPAQRELVQSLVDQLPEVVLVPLEPEVASEELAAGLMSPTWIPRSKNPEDLYAVYQGNTDAVSRTGLPQMQEEIRQVGIAPGLIEDHFDSWVRAAISQTPVVAGVLRLIEESGGVTEAQYAGLVDLTGASASDVTPADGLVVLQRWLSHFMVDDYETKQDSIRLIKAKRV